MPTAAAAAASPAAAVPAKKATVESADTSSVPAQHKVRTFCTFELQRFAANLLALARI